MTKQNKMYDKLYNFLVEEDEKNGIIPSVREIGEAMGLSSTCTVVYYLNKLEEMGKIKRDSRKSRTIQIVDKKPKKIITESENFVNIPLLGNVAAGSPILATENYEDVFKLPTNLFNKGELFMLTIQGESMIKIGINNGDLVIIRKQNTANNGEIIVALVDDSATVKRFYKENNRIKLQPENDSMKPMYFDDVQILGKVVGLIRQM